MMRRHSSAMWQWSAFAVLACVLVYVLAQRGVSTHGDDAMYARVLADGSALEYVQQRYRIWSGRALIDAVTVLTINHVIVWRAVTALCLLLCAWFIAHAAKATEQPVATAFACMAVLMLQPETAYGGIWWMTGSFNYLWAFTAALVAFIPFARPEVRPVTFALCALASLYAASQEQGGLLLMGLQGTAAIVLWKRRQLRPGHFVLMALVGTAFASVVLAPGTAQRFTVVTQLWFPQYLEWTWDERLFAGFDLAFSHGFKTTNLVAATLYLLLPVLVFQRTLEFGKRLLALIPLGVYLLPPVVMALMGELGVTHHMAARMWAYQTSPGRAGDGYDPFGLSDYAAATDSAFYWHFFVVACGTAATCASIANARLQGRYFGNRASLVLFCAAVLSSAVLGFSPTLYASGQRIFFYQDFLTAAIAVLVFTGIQGPVLKRSLVVAFLPLPMLQLWTILSRTVQ